MDEPNASKRRAVVSVGVVAGGCLTLVALGAASAAGVDGVSSLLVPLGVFIVLLTTVELLIARRL